MRKSLVLTVRATLPVLLAVFTLPVRDARSAPQALHRANTEIGGE